MFFKFIKPTKLTLNRNKTPYFWKIIKLKKKKPHAHQVFVHFREIGISFTNGIYTKQGAHHNQENNMAIFIDKV